MKLLIPLVLILGLSSCLATRAENAALIPAVVQAWPAVRTDVMEADAPPMAAVEAMDAAVEAESKALLRQVPWSLLRDAAQEGITNQLLAETIGPNGANLLSEQLRQMDAAMLQLQKPRLVSVSPQVLSLPTTEQRVAERRAYLSYSNTHRISR